MIFTVKLLESNSQIAQNILKALLPDVSKYLKDVIQYLQNNLPVVIRNLIQNTPEYEALMSGNLQYELGIPDPSTKLAGLLDIWSTNIKIIYNSPTIIGDKLKGSFSANMIKIDFSDVLYSDYAIIYDGLRGYSLPWLEWLLLEGNKTIIKNQNVFFGYNKYSRTGYALMKESPQSWKIPSEYAGTISDNWITRAIDNGDSQIQSLIDKAINI